MNNKNNTQQPSSCEPLVAERRNFLKVGTALTLGLASGAGTSMSAMAATSEPKKVFTYPYSGVESNDAAYARHISPQLAGFLKGTPLNVHYGLRDNARLQDVFTGRWYWNCHRNGSKYNLGHRNPVLVSALRDALEFIDAGSFSQLSGYRAKLAEQLSASTHHQLPGVTFGCAGAEANEMALHAAQNHTGRRKLVAISQTSFHGSTSSCLAVSGISGAQVERYRVDRERVTFVPFNDLEAMKRAITRETAAVIMEPAVAQAGFTPPAPGYLKGVREACSAAGALLIFDEVQTGVGATGPIWAYQDMGVLPDILTTGKGLGGGIYPISVALMKQAVWESYTQGQLLPHESTYGGSELGCVVASKVMEMVSEPAFQQHVRALSERFARGFAGAPFEVTQVGLCMGIRTQEPLATALKLVDAGVLVIPSMDDQVVPFRPILTLKDEDADEIIALVRKTLG